MTLSKFQIQEYVGLFRHLLETGQQDKALEIIERLGEWVPPDPQARQGDCFPCREILPFHDEHDS